MESSNIGTAQIADQVGRDARRRHSSSKMGFLDKVEIEIGERGRTLPPGQLGPVRDDDGRLWPGNRGHAAAPGDGLCDTVQRRHLSPGDLAEGRHRAIRSRRAARVFTEDTSYKMRAMLRLVVTNGTGKKADAPGYRIGGKTGTAQKVIGGHYSNDDQYHELRGRVPDGRAALCDGR